MNDEQIHIRIRQVPTVPPILALALLMMICGIFAAIYDFFAHNTDVLICLVIVPLTTWFAIGRRMRRNGHPYRAVMVTFGAVVAAIVLGNAYFEYKFQQNLSRVVAHNQKIAEETNLQEPEREKYCIYIVTYPISNYHRGAVDLENCGKFYTLEQKKQICTFYDKADLPLVSGEGLCASVGVHLDRKHFELSRYR